MNDIKNHQIQNNKIERMRINIPKKNPHSKIEYQIFKAYPRVQGLYVFRVYRFRV